MNFKHNQNTPFGFTVHKAEQSGSSQNIEMVHSEVNPAFECISGQRHEQIIGQPIIKTLALLEAENFDWLNFYNKLSSKTTKQEADVFFIRTGAWYHIQAFYQNTGIVHTYYTDITKYVEISDDEIKNTLHPLSEIKSELALYKDFLNFDQDCIFITKDSVCNYANKAAATVLGYSANEMIGLPILDLFAEESKKLVKKRLQSNFKSPYKAVALKKDNTQITVEFRSFEQETKLGNLRISKIKDISHTVNERRQVLKALKKLEIINSNIPNFILLAEISSDGKIANAEISDHADSFLAIPEGTINNDVNKCLSFVEPEYRSNIFEGIEEAIDRLEEVITTKYKVKKGNGESAWFSSSTKAIKTHNKHKIVAVTTDISSGKSSELARFKSEKRFRILFEKSPDAIFIVNKHTGKYSDANKSAEQLTGRSIKELKELHTSSVSPKNSSDQLKDVKASNTSLNFSEVTYTQPDGSEKNAELSTVPIDENTVFGIAHEITKRKKRETELTLTKESYYNIFNAISEAIFIQNEKGEFLDLNKGATKMYGYTKEELLGEIPVTLSAKGMNDLQQLQRTSEIVFRTGQPKEFEFWGRRKNGDIFPKHVILNKGKYFGKDVLIAAARDITKRKKIIDDLEIATQKAQESDRLKSSFLANMSHEIRTPMNAIVGFSSLLEETESSKEEYQRYAGIIKTSSDHLLHIINDIIDISKIESGKLKIKKEQININDILYELQTQFDSEIFLQKKPNLKLKLFAPYNNLELNTDETRFRQILLNLLSNAVKFSEEGEIKFGYEIIKGHILFFVKDSGIGIPKSEQKTIFDRFTQSSKTGEKLYGGTGLGLSIAKACSELLGGSIWLESEEDVGTSFYFTISAD